MASACLAPKLFAQSENVNFLCVLLLSKYVIHHTSKGYVYGQTCYQISDGDVNNTEDPVFINYLGNKEIHELDKGYTSEQCLANLLITTSLRTPNYTRNGEIQKFKDGIENSLAKDEIIDLILGPDLNRTYLQSNISKTTGFDDKHLYPNLSTDCFKPSISHTIRNVKKYEKGDDCEEIKWENRLYDGTTPMHTEDELKFRNDEDIPNTVNSTPTFKFFPVKNELSKTNNITTFIDFVRLISDRIKALKVKRAVPADSSDTNKSVNVTTTTSMLFKAKIKKNRNDFITNVSSKYEESETNGRRIRRSPPECPSKWTMPSLSWTTTPPFLGKYNPNRTGDLCYVCGLEEEEIPHSSLCEDAFSGDQRYGEYKHRFKKYCRYLNDEANYCVNKHVPRSVFGRWSGGCSTRTIDISGIYTQRSCRNKEKPTTGLSFASHRMAKLELILNDVADGCVTSPHASLLPFSRAVSLFARFHACVCTGHWCNTSISNFSPSHITSTSLYIIAVIIEALIYC